VRVLVTGAKGQVGWEVVELLGAAPHHDVLALAHASGCSRYAGNGSPTS
jgi:nucleoside-diphosphate-sugar epimerase